MAAARLSTFASKVTTTLAPVRSKVVESYSKMMADNAQYVVTDAAVEDKLLKQWFFTKMSKIGPTMKAADAEAQLWRKSWDNRNSATVGEVSRMALFGAEVVAWFAVGEYVGRGFKPAPL
uniref:Uncharacterized protein n=1 Tax=Pycnococcus provasolii TaxID=41880 RepID=A0A7S2F008_9CHLO